MRKLLLAAWLLVPVGAFAYHMGPGQDQLRLDDAEAALARAAEHVAQAQDQSQIIGDAEARDHWLSAKEAYEEALSLLPDDAYDAQRRARLERAKCRMQISELPTANKELVSLLDELMGEIEDGTEVEVDLLHDTRRTLANSEYYMTWLMRLEGLSREAWGPRIDAARQTFKLLAEEDQADSKKQQALQEDLEAAIRLARMDLTELQGLPLPSQ